MPRSSSAHAARGFRTFGLRTLTCVVLMIGLWLGWLVRSARMQGQAVDVLRAANARVRYSSEWSNGKTLQASRSESANRLVEFIGADYFEHVTYVEFHGPDIDALTATLANLPGIQRLDLAAPRLQFSKLTLSDVGLGRLSDLVHLRWLDLRDTKVTDAGLTYLENLNALRALNLAGTQISDAGASRLKGLRQLTELDLVGTRIGDAGLAQLKDLRNLSVLYLGETRLSDDGLPYMDRRTSIRQFDQSTPRITDGGLIHIARLSQLSTLSLRHTQITDAGMKHLAKLSNLSILDLVGTDVTDVGIVHLRGLAHLSELYLGNTGVTDAGMEELQQALPVLVIRDPYNRIFVGSVAAGSNPLR